MTQVKIKKLNTSQADKIKKLLKENGGYCPCLIEQNKDTKCMCKKFREQEEGICHCGLYEKIKGEK